VHVGGRFSLDDSSSVAGNVYALSMADIDYNVDIAGNIYLQSGNISIGDGSVIQQGLYAGGNVTMSYNVTVGSEVYADGTLTMTDNANINGDLFATGNLSVGYFSDVVGDITSESAVTIDDTTEVTGNVVAGSNVIIDYDTTINGNVYANGNVSLGDGVRVTGNVYAVGSISEGFGVTVDGTACGDGTCEGAAATTITPPLATIPAPNTTIQLPTDPWATERSFWKSDAEAGGTAVCSGGTYVVDLSTGPKTLGPIKVPCNLEISNVFGGENDLTLAGPIWVTGDVQIDFQSDIVISGSLSGLSVPIIAEGRISIDERTDVIGSGAKSYVIFASESTLSNSIYVNYNTDGDYVLYAPNGSITGSNGLNINGGVVGNLNVSMDYDATIGAAALNLQNIQTSSSLPITVDGLAGAIDVAVSGNYAYVSGGNEDAFAVIDITDKSNPQYVTHLHDAERPGGGTAHALYGPQDIEIFGELCICCCGTRPCDIDNRYFRSNKPDRSRSACGRRLSCR
jgi:predicted acyltransferase (DUF342 family)